ncbi:MAG TPA: NADH-ubiquinone oxidoreductase-F iron-sulfur binding region domain-containing protein [Acidimicrobiales bacterium]|nr:NADH-ubiquinone oxidoreductase-F iron-sulfur binding region domain-containing protein [Acidimicrobiales bacterium]
MTDLALAPAERLLPSGPGGNAGPGLDAHLDRHGDLRIPTRKDPAWRAGILWAVAASGLVGRGGAGFPAVAKWDSVAHRSRRPVVVVNAMEGEPASAKDRVLLACSPHLVLDGAYVAATAVGASEIVVCVADHSQPAAASIEAAIAERRRAGTAVVRASVQRPPGRYVTGEESALAGWLESRRALPALRTDKSVPVTIGRRPALVHNAETLSQLALIARHGPEWFRAMGTAEAPGSTLVTVTGAVRQPGVLEVELGTPLVDILARAGLDTELSAVLLGGYGGAWLDPSRLSTPYAPGPLTAAGGTQGVGVVIALPATSCGVAETARIVRYMAGESAGQCGPCVFGLPAIADDLEELWAGRAVRGVLERITTRAAAVDGRGACRHPDGASRVVRTALAVFAADAAAHAEGRPCGGHVAPTVLTLPGPTADRRVR